jgi:hypothetical protein
MTGDLVPTEFGLAKTSLVEATPKALCHPHRDLCADSLCKECFAAREELLDSADPDETGKPLTQKQILAKLQRHTEFIEGMARAAETLEAHMKGYGIVARQILESNLPRYALLHVKAATVAAEDGDAKPAQWALQNLKPGGRAAVEPPPKVVAEKGDKVQVLIGVNMGQTPAAERLSATVVQTTEADRG